MAGTKTKTQARKQTNKNPHESFRDMAGFFTDGLKKQTNVRETSEEFFKQLINLDLHKGSDSAQMAEGGKTGELIEGQEVTLFEAGKKQKAKEKAPRPDILSGIDYRAEVVQGGDRLKAGEKRELKQAIEQIRVEIQQLIASSSMMQEEFAEVTMQQAPTTPGKYHLTFFTWLLAVIRSAKMKVEDGGAWLNTMNKKKGKMGYWGMAKKHGTSFSLSGERVVATQTG